jgi:uncharacterized protein (TIGR02270 family)
MTATSVRQFRVALYEEHLDEAAFLWEQCRALRTKPDIAWTEVAAFEERLEAHLDALIVGGELALDVCRRRAAEGEPGELFASVAVFCRHGDPAAFASTLRGVDFQQPERARAVADALKEELPASWNEHAIRAVSQSQGPLVAVLATVIGHRRLPQSDVIVDVLPRTPETQQEALVWALGRTRPARGSRALRPLFTAANAAVRGAALRAALRNHDPEAAAVVLSAAAGDADAISVAMCGDRSVVAGLVAASRKSDAPAEVPTALGLLGDLSAVRPLVHLLSVAPLARAAAQALYVITGAPLFDAVAVPDPLGEDEMFDAELAEFRATGVRPGRGDGQPYSTTVRALATDPQAWEAWLQGNAAQFKADRRYRLGREYGPDVLLECLASETFPKSYRPLAADELLIRYGIDVPFEPDLPVAVQQRVIEAGAEAVRATAATFDRGRWYCFGHAGRGPAGSTAN